MATTAMNWEAIDADPRFQELHRRKSRFLWALMIFSIVYYFLLPVGAAYFTDLVQDQGVGPGQLRHSVRALGVRGGLGHCVHLRPRCEPHLRSNGGRNPQEGGHDRGGEMRSSRSLTVLGGLGLLALAASAHAFFKGGAVPERFGWLAVLVFGDNHRDHHVRDVSGGEASQDHSAVLCRRPVGERLAERLGDRRRLPVRSLVPRHRRA